MNLYELEFLSSLSGLYSLKGFKWLKSKEKWSVIRGKLYRILLLLFISSVISNSWQPQELQHTRLPCPSLSPRVCSNSCPLCRGCRPTMSSSVVPFFSCLQSCPASGSFPMSQFFTSGGQGIGTSASASALVLPMNILVLYNFCQFQNLFQCALILEQQSLKKFFDNLLTIDSLWDVGCLIKVPRKWGYFSWDTGWTVRASEMECMR